MKKIIFALAALVLCLACAVASAVPVTAFGCTFDSEDTYIDLKDKKIQKAETLAGLIDQMPNLKKVDMYKSRMNNTELDILWERYPDIEFGWTVRVGDHLVRTDATAFSTLHDPDRDKKHKTKDFYALKFCKKLEALDIGHNLVDDISFLRNLPNLKVLILACNKIEDISVLAELTQLEYIELFTNKFTDITPLAGLTNLVDLNLSNNAIDDLTCLYGLKKLGRFRLCMDKALSEEQKEAFQQALPDCQMGWLTHPTGEGWREHPHYDTIYRIFHSNTYEPF